MVTCTKPFTGLGNPETCV